MNCEAKMHIFNVRHLKDEVSPVLYANNYFCLKIDDDE
jgi:hypothetical protein